MAINDFGEKKKGENFGTEEGDAGVIRSTSQVADDEPFYFKLVFAWSYILSSREVELLQYMIKQRVEDISIKARRPRSDEGEQRVTDVKKGF